MLMQNFIKLRAAVRELPC